VLGSCEKRRSVNDPNVLIAPSTSCAESAFSSPASQ
jgi:hypothetical protein